MFDMIHHVAIIAADYPRSRAFYVDTLGFEVVREVYREARNDHLLVLRMGSCELELFGMPNAPKRPSYPEACGLRHLAFRVPDVAAAVAALEAHGVPCEPIRIDPYTHTAMTFFHDPDGLPLELHE